MKIFRTLTFIFVVTACIALITITTLAEAQAQTQPETIPSGSGKKIHKNAVIDCFKGKFYSMGDTDYKHTELYESKHLTYYAFGEANTEVIIEFDNSDPNCRDYSPTGDNKITGKINSVEKPWVKTTNGVKANMDGYCYSYTVTCRPAGDPDPNHAKKVDPIIDVPR
jgi:hypothetical protein